MNKLIIANIETYRSNPTDVALLAGALEVDTEKDVLQIVGELVNNVKGGNPIIQSLNIAYVRNMDLKLVRLRENITNDECIVCNGNISTDESDMLHRIVIPVCNNFHSDNVMYFYRFLQNIQYMYVSFRQI